ncbi:MAG TPA: YihY/virulence factor BrkB family protein [Candidatus Limnocylindrales bacterium]|nr:YihY/virulence factor BrkB family protein [Candidatus Limnocylindrales bacterium]
MKGIVDRLMSVRAVRTVMAVMGSAGALGLPLLAMALAFTTMFALIPAVLLLSGVLGWFVADPVIQQDLLGQLIAAVPPLAGLFEDQLESLVESRAALSIVGLLGLIWGASNFYAALDEVMRRFFPGGKARGFVSQRLRGIVAVAVLVGLVIGTIAMGGIWTFLQSTLGVLGPMLSLAMPLLSITLVTVIVLVVYRYVPTAPPPWRAALPPAIVAGIGIGLLTSLFAVLAPVLVGGLQAFGVIATVFAGFIWLNFCYQMLLYGAAWARYRRDAAQLQDRPAA